MSLLFLPFIFLIILKDGVILLSNLQYEAIIDRIKLIPLETFQR